MQKQRRITEENKTKAGRKYAGQQKVKKLLLPEDFSIPELNRNLNR
jgi:hypothetical protein